LLPDAIDFLGLVYGAEAVLLIAKNGDPGKFKDLSIQAHRLRIAIHAHLCENEPLDRSRRSFFWFECISEVAALYCLLPEYSDSIPQHLQCFFESDDLADKERFAEKQFELWVLSVAQRKPHRLLACPYTEIYDRQYSATSGELTAILCKLRDRRTAQIATGSSDLSLPFNYMLLEIVLLNRMRRDSGLPEIEDRSLLGSIASEFTYSSSEEDPRLVAVRERCTQLHIRGF